MSTRILSTVVLALLFITATGLSQGAPQNQFVFGQTHHVLGNAQLNVDPGALGASLTGLGSSGNDGCQIQFPATDKFKIEIQNPWPNPCPPGPNTSIEFRNASGTAVRLSKIPPGILCEYLPVGGGAGFSFDPTETRDHEHDQWIQILAFVVNTSATSFSVEARSDQTFRLDFNATATCYLPDSASTHAVDGFSIGPIIPDPFPAPMTQFDLVATNVARIDLEAESVGLDDVEIEADSNTRFSVGLINPIAILPYDPNLPIGVIVPVGPDPEAPTGIQVGDLATTVGSTPAPGSQIALELDLVLPQPGTCSCSPLALTSTLGGVQVEADPAGYGTVGVLVAEVLDDGVVVGSFNLTTPGPICQLPGWPDSMAFKTTAPNGPEGSVDLGGDYPIVFLDPVFPPPPVIGDTLIVRPQNPSPSIPLAAGDALKVRFNGFSGGVELGNWQVFTTPVNPVFPGTGEGLVLRTSDPAMGGALSVVDVKTYAGNDFLTCEMYTGNAGLQWSPLLLAADVQTAGSTPLSPLPGVGVGIASAFLIGDASAPFGSRYLSAHGSTISIQIPVGLVGSDVFLQAIVISPSAGNGFLATSNTHRLEVR